MLGVESQSYDLRARAARSNYPKRDYWPSRNRAARVQRERQDRLGLGWANHDRHARFVAEGAIGSHLKNLQRRDGYKGFNQRSVGPILKAVAPRRS